MTSTKPGGPPPAGPSLSAGAEKAGDVTSAGDANNQFTGASVAGGYRNPDATTNAAQYGSVVGSGVGTVTSAAGLVGQGSGSTVHAWTGRTPSRARPRTTRWAET
ncbi:hypothetical protein E4K10_42410 [Streptomyces sp. T1317-0309]|nr:hypothetical protein E4K10_42410 [Streptomyces sp. T1317-0309]